MTTLAPEEPKLLITVTEFARRFGISDRLAWAIVLRGEVASCRVGRLRRVIVSDLADYVERQRAR